MTRAIVQILADRADLDHPTLRRALHAGDRIEGELFADGTFGYTLQRADRPWSNRVTLSPALFRVAVAATGDFVLPGEPPAGLGPATAAQATWRDRPGLL